MADSFSQGSCFAGEKGRMMGIIRFAGIQTGANTRLNHLHFRFDITEFSSVIQETFPDELVYLGLHGSYSSGCATPFSDVDFTLVLNAITPTALRKLKTILADHPHASVYLLGEADLSVRPLSNNLQFFYGQRPLYGTMHAQEPSRHDLVDSLLLTLEDIRQHYRYFFLSEAETLPVHIAATLGKLVFWWYQTYLLLVKGKYIATPEHVANAIDDSCVTEALRQYEKTRWDSPGRRTQSDCLLRFHPIVDDMIIRLSALRDGEGVTL